MRLRIRPIHLKNRCAKLERFIKEKAKRLSLIIESKNESAGVVTIDVKLSNGISPRDVMPYIADSLTRNVPGYRFYSIEAVPNLAFGGETATFGYRREA